MLTLLRWRVVKRLIVIVGMLALAVPAYAQEATVSGTVTDSTGGVLPGVAVTALHEASGNTFQAVTDARGAYRIPVRIGVYQLTAQLQGFATVTRAGLEMPCTNASISGSRSTGSNLCTLRSTASGPSMRCRTGCASGLSRLPT